MPLTEQQAQQITLVRVLEQTHNNGALWSADDAKEATRATIELVGPKSSFAEFVARRAQWALEKISKRAPDRAIQLRQPRWPLVAGQVLAAFALACGFMTDLLATNLMHPGQINIIELPLVLLIVWNLAFFGWFFVNWVLRLFQRGKQPIGPLTELFGGFRASESIGFGRRRPRPWAEGFKHDWSQLSGPVNEVRLKMAASLASMLFTLVTPHTNFDKPSHAMRGLILRFDPRQIGKCKHHTESGTRLARCCPATYKQQRRQV
jgi:hypothetical protein